MLTVYGIRNCDTVRKALKWFDAHQLTWQFHDVQKDGLNEALVRHWLTQRTPEALINRRSTTWRQLPESERDIRSSEDAVRLIMQHPTLLRRPLVTEDNTLLAVGFDTDTYSQQFLTHS